MGCLIFIVGITFVMGFINPLWWLATFASLIAIILFYIEDNNIY